MNKSLDSLLDDIDNDFNKSLPDSGFRLTKMFERGSLPVKIINTVLLAACTAGAFNVQAQNLEDVNLGNNIEQTQQVMFEELENDFEIPQPCDENSLNKLKTAFEDVKKIELDDLKEIVDSKQASVFKVGELNELVILAFDSNEYPLPQEAKDWLKLGTISNNPFSTATVYEDCKEINFINIKIDRNTSAYDPIDEEGIIWDDEITSDSPDNPFEDIEVVAENTLSFEDPDVIERAVIQENVNLITFVHELSHTNSNQKKLNDIDMGRFEKVIKKETVSDVFSILGTSSIKNFDHATTVQMIEDLAEKREERLGYGDFDHATTASLYALADIIHDNPEMLDDLKSFKIQELDNVSFDFAISAVEKTKADYSKDPLDRKVWLGLQDGEKTKEDLTRDLLTEFDKEELSELSNILKSSIEKNKLKMEMENTVNDLKEEVSVSMGNDEPSNVSLSMSTKLKY